MPVVVMVVVQQKLKFLKTAVQGVDSGKVTE